jgi:hypothetical protein
MARRNYTAVRDSLHRGINQQPELVMPGEVADSRNMWVRKGRLQTRPGYEGIGTLNAREGFTALTSRQYVTEISGAFTDYASFVGVAFGIGDRLYLGFTNDPTDLLMLSGVANETSGNKPHGLLEYNDGTSWKPLRYFYGGFANSFPVVSASLFEDVSAYPTEILNVNTTRCVSFVSPADWAQVDVNGNTRYWLRWTILGATATLDSKGAIGVFASGDNHLNFAYGCKTRLSSALLYAYFFANNGNRGDFRKIASPGSPGFGWVEQDFTGNFIDENAAPSYAFLQETEELYVAIRGTVSKVPLEVAIADQEFDARIEDDETLVGDRAPYSRDYIAQLTGYPEADRLLWARSRMWVADGNRLRWSAPYPYHDVFPAFNTAIVGEDDMSDISALAPLGEHVVIFKESSIYLAVAAGQTEFSTQQYAIVRIVSGVGCVAENSIQKIRGRLVFLGADGLYVFDGTPNIRKATLGQPARGYGPPDRLCRYFQGVNYGHAHKAVSANMPGWGCYLLSLPYGESQINDEVVVWDYEQDAFWIWDAISAQHVIEGRIFGRPDTLYFINDKSQIFALGQSKYDHYQTISAHVTTREIALKQHERFRMRQVDILSDAESQTVTIDVRRHEDEVNSVTGTADLTDSKEPSWSDPPVDGVTEWAKGGRRYTHIGFRIDGDAFNVKLSQAVAGQRFRLSSMSAELLPLRGRR